MKDNCERLIWNVEAVVSHGRALFLSILMTLLRSHITELFTFTIDYIKHLYWIFINLHHYCKVRDLHLLCYLIWSRWFNFWVNCSSVFKFDYILLQCSICSFYRKDNDQNVLKKLVPTYANFLEHVNSNTYIFFGLMAKTFFQCAWFFKNTAIALTQYDKNISSCKDDFISKSFERQTLRLTELRI